MAKTSKKAARITLLKSDKFAKVAGKGDRKITRILTEAANARRENGGFMMPERDKKGALRLDVKTA